MKPLAAPDRHDGARWSGAPKCVQQVHPSEEAQSAVEAQQAATEIFFHPVRNGSRDGGGPAVPAKESGGNDLVEPAGWGQGGLRVNSERSLESGGAAQDR